MAYPIHYENIQPDPTKQVAISRVSQEPGERYWNFTHFHKMHEVIKYTDVESGIITINGKEYALTPNTLVYIPSMSVHDLQIPESSKRSWALMQFEPDLLDLLHFSKYSPYFSNPSVTTLSAAESAHFEYLFDWYYQVYHAENSQLGKRILALLLQVILDVLKDDTHTASQPLPSTKGIMQFTPLLIHLEQNNLFNLSLDSASHMCSLSKFHFSRLFKLYFNLTYNEYLLKRKIGMAMTQLNNSELSIRDVSQACGFNDTAYFCKKFKRETGKTPKEFRALVL